MNAGNPKFHSDEDEVFTSSGKMASFSNVRPIDAPVSEQMPEQVSPAWSLSTFDDWSH